MIHNRNLKLYKFSDKLLKKNKISIDENQEEQIIEQLVLYIDTIMFNIISIICLITVLNDKEKITLETLEVAKKYIHNKCYNGKMNGGSVIGSATYLGVEEPMYKVDNPTNDILNINLINGVARPQIGGKKNKIYERSIYAYINSILIYHDVKATKELKKDIYNIINNQIECLINQLMTISIKKKITLKKMINIAKKNKLLYP